MRKYLMAWATLNQIELIWAALVASGLVLIHFAPV
jgi:hypothetical protein